MRKLSPVLSTAALLAASALAAPARAQPSAWMFVGGGALVWKNSATDSVPATSFTSPMVAGTMTIDVGAGLSPDASFIGGALFRIQPIFGSGADLALLGRLCSHGFQAGDFGFAVDAGAFARPWGAKSIGFSGGVSIGLPLGFTITAQTEVGTAGVVALGGFAGIDLLRLTIYRRTLQNWWQNPSPAYKTKQTAVSELLRF